MNSALYLLKAKMRTSKKRKKEEENAKRQTQENNSYPNIY